jgi:gamma-glutamylcyclotransferase (GGCT)/AIG2-like uncharacterized protein YtfP
MTNEYLFAYGTLRHDIENKFATLLRRSAEWLGPGRVRGQLYLIADYPGLVRSEAEGDWVSGDVYCLQSPELIRVLDEYEGCDATQPAPREYSRLVTPVLLESGIWIVAFAYFYVLDVTRKRRIGSGDFLAGV